MPAPFRHILCAVGGTAVETEAVGQAAALCGPDGVLTLLSVTDGAPTRAEEALAGAERMALERGVAPRLRLVRSADVRSTVLEEAADHDLLVVGAHRRARPTDYLLGSTTIAALHRSPVPVLVARPVQAFPRELLLATDGSPLMAPTVMTTAALARRYDARVAIVHVDHGRRAVRRELAEQATTLLEATGTEPVVMQLLGHAPSRIAQAALDTSASLVITGSRLLGGWHIVTSVSERIAAVAPCSVLVMRHAPAEPHRRQH